MSLLMLGSGLIFGAVVTWVLCSLRSKALVSATEAGAVGKVKEAEGIALELRARIGELRQNLADSTRDLSLARDHLMLEREQKAASQTELSQLRATLEDVSALRE